MKRINHLLSKIILLLIAVQFISAQEEEASDIDIVGTGSFGAATINGKIYNQISFFHHC